MPHPENVSPTQIFQLKITLVGSKPPIWRRVEVPASDTLAQLHTIIQTAMGWHNCHLHQFTMGGAHYGIPDPGDFVEIHDERQVTLAQRFTAPKQKLTYEYDFGDGWEHALLVEKLLPADATVRYPRCTAGKRACPPEDCGGIWGYAALLEAIADPQHPEHDDKLAWVGGAFEAEQFDVAAVNAALQERH